MSVQEKKKSALASFHQAMRDIHLEGSKKVAAGRLAVSCPEGTTVVIQMLTIRAGMGVGEFAAYSALGLYGGKVFQILKATRLDGGGTYPKDLIVQGTSHALVPTLKRGVYAFRAPSAVESVVAKMAKDIEKFYVPIVQAFTGGYGKALDFILSTNGAHVRKPFCMSLVLLGLAGESDRLAEVTAHAKRDKGFWDYHKAQDADSIARRVEQWFRDHDVSNPPIGATKQRPSGLTKKRPATR